MKGDATITAREGMRELDGVLVRRLTQVYPGPARAFTLDRSVVIGREPPRDGISIDDREASRRHAELTFARELGVYRLKDLGSKNGTHLFGERVETPAYVRHGAVIRTGGTFFVYSEVHVTPEQSRLEVPPHVSPLRAAAEALADRAAKSDLAVLVIGPTGAGKELVSQRIHEASERSGPMVAVNCATFGKDLVASELFGHKAGAFSGATADRPGLFMTTSGGTLFLDEIAELPLDQQPALLRALQEKRVRPVGADADVPVDVRVVAATHQDLEALVEQGRFREDLFGRLCGVVIELPGLSERREEILHLFSRFLGNAHPPLTVGAVEALLSYRWPRNVRELQHAAEHVKLYGDVERVETRFLPKQVQQSAKTSAPRDAEVRPSREAIAAALSSHGGNVAKAARSLGHHRQALYRWMKAYGLDPSDFRSSS